MTVTITGRAINCVWPQHIHCNPLPSTSQAITACLTWINVPIAILLLGLSSRDLLAEDAVVSSNLGHPNWVAYL
jgi:hypothetical protein